MTLETNVAIGFGIGLGAFWLCSTFCCVGLVARAAEKVSNKFEIKFK